MILAYHFIFSAYGFWLPNDPRGSWSDTIRVYELLKYGPAAKITTTRSVAHVPHDRAKRLEAKGALKYPPVRFTGTQARAIARGFAIAAGEGGYIFRALAILPDHCHMVIERHATPIDHIARHLKAKATARLSLEGRHPLSAYLRADRTTPSPWSRNYWCAFIDSEKHLRAAIRYVERNPPDAGLPRQTWSVCAGAPRRRGALVASASH
jgi:REP element-mobilizing transposase RayT